MKFAKLIAKLAACVAGGLVTSVGVAMCFLLLSSGVVQGSWNHLVHRDRGVFTQCADCESPSERAAEAAYWKRVNLVYRVLLILGFPLGGFVTWRALEGKGRCLEARGSANIARLGAKLAACLLGGIISAVATMMVVLSVALAARSPGMAVPIQPETMRLIGLILGFPLGAFITWRALRQTVGISYWSRLRSIRRHEP